MSPDRNARLKQLERSIVGCRLCSRLTSFRESAPARASFASQEYWRRPVPSFGDPRAWLMVIGLAPAANGGNRTGRLFTGDESARFLMKALHATGFANQPTSRSKDDGLTLDGCYITAAVRCVPPDNKPNTSEFANCGRYLGREFEILSDLRAVVALGQLAFKAYVDLAKSKGASLEGAKFAHGARVKVPGMPWLYGSYHPSPRNTYTGRLSEKMLVQVFERVKGDWGS